MTRAEHARDEARNRLARRLMRRLASRIDQGRLLVVTPDGRREVFGDPAQPMTAEIHLHRWRAVWRLVLGGGVGFAEAYLAGDWDTPDLAALLDLASRNERLSIPAQAGPRAMTWLRRLWHRRNDNTRRGSRRNIAAHYDLGNAFYRRWLDPSMTYSSAIFTTADQDLAAAQENKYRALARKLALDPSHHVLEIGCGWGGFATFLAREVGCRVTAITISREQLAFASERVRSEGLAERVTTEFRDYRDVGGSFDRIVSIEMIEAVGERHWPVYFAKLRDCLVPGGRAGIQAITIADRWYESYRRGVDFIQRYVFPGGMLPSPSALSREIAGAGLRVERIEWYGEHYARTLAEWQRRFQAAWPDLERDGLDRRFKRLWEFYLAYCEAGFRTASTDVAQVSIVRP